MLKQQYMYRTFYLELNFNEKLNEMIYCIYGAVRNKLWNFWSTKMCEYLLSWIHLNFIDSTNISEHMSNVVLFGGDGQVRHLNHVRQDTHFNSE